MWCNLVTGYAKSKLCSCSPCTGFICSSQQQCTKNSSNYYIYRRINFANFRKITLTFYGSLRCRNLSYSLTCDGLGLSYRKLVGQTYCTFAHSIHYVFYKWSCDATGRLGNHFCSAWCTGRVVELQGWQVIWVRTTCTSPKGKCPSVRTKKQSPDGSPA